jgi:exodeoxyribonuclease V alpha subunit
MGAGSNTAAQGPSHPGLADELVGEVSFVVYADTTTGFGVVQLTGSGDAHDARATGPLAGLVAGQPVRLLGRWIDHHKHGPTFEALAYEQAQPVSTAGLRAFLASSRFKGVGDATARKLVTRFGLDLGQVITQEPERLAEVPGVSPALAATIADAWRQAGVLAELVQRLGAAGVPPQAAQAAQRRFGDQVLLLLDEDPYAFLAVRGVGWAHAEALARTAGISATDERRLAAGAVEAVAQLRARAGHVAVPDDLVLVEARRVLQVDPIDVRRGLDLATARRSLVRDAADDVRWYTPADHAAEVGLAGDLARLLGARSRLRAAAKAEHPPGDLTPEQAEAVRTALRCAVSVLTGGPGTGKTRTVVEILAACAAHDLTVALCAPTGRAAKRLEEVTGHPATTVHRLLEARPGDGDGGFRFGYGRDRRLPFDLVVADEWSMADLHLAAALVRAIESGSHLLLVGDADQLPSVGPGAVLRDLLDSAVVPSVRLVTIHRQAAESRIVTLAHEINAGAVPPLAGRNGDVFVVREQPHRIADRVAEIVAVRAPAFYGCAPADVQVMAPMYRGPAGVDALNARLKERLNPAGGRPAVGGFHEGDRVVQTRNDAELEVANGDIGEVAATDAKARTLEVAFPQGVVAYDPEQVADLRPAWCLTVHKSQGGEWPVVILVLDPGHRAMLWRELVYTAVTRAAVGLLLVGDAGLLRAAAHRTGSGARDRQTRLADRLALTADERRMGSTGLGDPADT